MEKVANKQLLQVIEGNYLSGKFHWGFQKCHSTETALLKVTKDILMSSGTGNVTEWLDLTVAFDTVSNKNILGDWKHVLDWTKQLLTVHLIWDIKVTMDSVPSWTAHMSKCSPGSVLGPVQSYKYAVNYWFKTEYWSKWWDCVFSIW